MNEEICYPSNPVEYVIKYRKYDLQEVFASEYSDAEDAELMKSDLEFDEMSINDLRQWVDEVFNHEDDEHIEGAYMTEAELVECLKTCDFWLIEI